MTTPGGRLLLNDGASRLPLTPQADGSLTGTFTIDKQGFYRIELDGPHGEKVDRLAAVHDRRARRSAADGVVREAGARHAARARSKKCSPRRRPTTTSA